jgi:hypothetical protein
MRQEINRQRFPFKFLVRKNLELLGTHVKTSILTSFISENNETHAQEANFSCTSYPKKKKKKEANPSSPLPS